jgi:hypothetical protein
LKFLPRRRKPFRRRATFAWRAFVTSELVELHGQQYHCSVCSGFQRDRYSGVDHLFGLGPVRVASLKSSPLGLVAALAQRGSPVSGARRADAHATPQDSTLPHHRSSPPVIALFGNYSRPAQNYHNTSIWLISDWKQIIPFTRVPTCRGFRPPTGCGFDWAAWPPRSHRPRPIPRASQRRSPAISCSIPLIVP